MFTKNHEAAAPTKTVTPADVQSILEEHKDWLKLVYKLDPPELGTTIFSVELEYKYFTPDTDKNAEFGMLTAPTFDGGTLAIVIVPKEMKDVVDLLLAKHNLSQELCDISEFTDDIHGAAIKLKSTLNCGHLAYIKLLTNEAEFANQFIESLKSGVSSNQTEQQTPKAPTELDSLTQLFG